VQTDVVTPQSRETFHRSKLRWEERTRPDHAGTLSLYHELLALRHRKQHVYGGARGTWTAQRIDERALAVRLDDQSELDSLLVVVSLTGGTRVELTGVALANAHEHRNWRPLIDTDDVRFGGPGVGTASSGDTYDLSLPRGLIFECS